jgi:flavin-binding protein dodecin
MSVVKVVQIIGQSPDSFDAAVKNAVSETTRTVRNVKSFQVDEMSGEVGADGKVANYRASVKIAFVVEGSSADS